MKDEEFYKYIFDREKFDKSLRIAAITSLVNFMNVMNTIDRRSMARDTTGAVASDEVLFEGLRRFEEYLKEELALGNRRVKSGYTCTR